SAIEIPSDSRPSRFGDRSHKPSVHNCAKLTDAEYSSTLDSTNVKAIGDYQILALLVHVLK
ncbi:MAG: hypothetical protein OXT74_19035, partial [Candidatus Poribacteria bacterium]|nr:hypothetical protein [Candidatus Poribacteria bacterium]